MSLCVATTFGSDFTVQNHTDNQLDYPFNLFNPSNRRFPVCRVDEEIEKHSFCPQGYAVLHSALFADRSVRLYQDVTELMLFAETAKA